MNLHKILKMYCILFIYIFEVYGNSFVFNNFIDLPGSCSSIASSGSYLYVQCDYSILNTIKVDLTGNFKTVNSSKFNEKSYSYSDLFLKDEHLFLTSNDTLIAFDISNRDKPVEVSRAGLGSQFSQFSYDILTENFLYSISEYHMLSIADISDFRNPQPAGSLYFDSTESRVSSVALSDKYLFVVSSPSYSSWSDTLRSSSFVDIIDVSDPSVPVNMHFILPCSTACSYQRIVISDNHAFIISENQSSDSCGYEDAIIILDISVPENPVHISTTSLHDCSGMMRNMFVHENMLHIESDSSWIVMDITDLQKPIFLSSHKKKFRCDFIFSSENKTLFGYSIYNDLQLTKYGIASVDLNTDFEHTTLDTGSVFTVMNMEFKDGFLYTAAGNSGVNIFSIDSPLHPVRMGNCATEHFCSDVALSDNYIYAAQNTGIAIIDVSDGMTPVLRSSISSESIIDDTRGVSVTSLKMTTQYAVILSEQPNVDEMYYPGFAYLNISSPLQFDHLGVILCARPSSASFLNTCLYMTYAPVMNSCGCIPSETSYEKSHGGLMVMDLPLSESPDGNYGVCPNSVKEMPGDALNISVQGNRAYIADGRKGITVLDISNPAWPSIIGTYPTPGIASAIALSETRAFVADSWNEISVFDISDSTSAHFLGTLQTQQTPVALEVYKSEEGSEYLYSAEGERGLKVIRITKEILSNQNQLHFSGHDEKKLTQRETSVTCILNNTLLMSGTVNRYIRIYDLKGRKTTYDRILKGTTKNMRTGKINMPNGIYVIKQN